MAMPLVDAIAQGCCMDYYITLLFLFFFIVYSNKPFASPASIYFNGKWSRVRITDDSGNMLAFPIHLFLSVAKLTFATLRTYQLPLFTVYNGVRGVRGGYFNWLMAPSFPGDHSVRTIWHIHTANVIYIICVVVYQRENETIKSWNISNIMKCPHPTCPAWTQYQLFWRYPLKSKTDAEPQGNACYTLIVHNSLKPKHVIVMTAPLQKSRNMETKNNEEKNKK